MGGQAVILRLFPPDERVEPDCTDGFLIAVGRHFFTPLQVNGNDIVTGQWQSGKTLDPPDSRHKLQISDGINPNQGAEK